MMASASAGEAPEQLNAKAFESRNPHVWGEQTGVLLERTSHIGFMDRVLHFLSTASNEKLGACALALGLVTYLGLGRFGLVLTSIVAGVVLHATLEGYTGSGVGGRTRDKENIRRKETGLDIVARVLDWRQGPIVSNEGDNQGNTNADAIQPAERQEDFGDFRPETRAALSRLVDAVIRDYVQ